MAKPTEKQKKEIREALLGVEQAYERFLKEVKSLRKERSELASRILERAERAKMEETLQKIKNHQL